MIWLKVLDIPVWNYFFDEGSWGNDGVSFSLIQTDSTDDYVKPAALATMVASTEIANRPYLSMPATGIPQTYEATFGADQRRVDPAGRRVVRRAGRHRCGDGDRPRWRLDSGDGDRRVRQRHQRLGHLGHRLQPAHLRPGHLPQPTRWATPSTIGPTQTYGTNLATSSRRGHRHRHLGERLGAIDGLHRVRRLELEPQATPPRA